MIVLANTTDKVQLVTTATAQIDCVLDYADIVASTGLLANPPAGRELHSPTSAATTDILAAPSSSNIRKLRGATISNVDTAASNTVTVLYNANGTTYRSFKVTLYPGDTLEYQEGLGWYVVPAGATPLKNASTASQGAGFSSDTYLTGSNITIPASLPVVGTAYKLIFDVVKSGAGTATPVLSIRFGTGGSTADTARLTFTFGAGTAAADTGVIEALCLFRTVGPGTSAVLQGQARLTSNLTTTGLSNAVKALQVTSGGFDSTVANSIIGASWNGGASASHTVQLVRAELIG